MWSDTAYIRNWVPVRLPWMLLLANTAVLIVSSITIDLARREITREAALAPVQSIPGISLGDERHFPWLDPDHRSRSCCFLPGNFLFGASFRGRLSPRRRHQQFLRLHSYGDARASSGRRGTGSFVRPCRGGSASSDRNPPHRRRHCVLVLALHDGAVDLHPCVVLVCGGVRRSLVVSRWSLVLCPSQDLRQSKSLSSQQRLKPALKTIHLSQR